MRRPAVLSLVLAWCLCVPALAAAASAPTIEYFAPSPLRNHEATLRFAVDPNGLETTYEVEYGTEAGSYFPNFGIRSGTLPAGEEPVTLEVEVPAFFEASLQAGTEYHWRVVAKNSAGTTEGPDQVFTTPDEPAPVFVTGTATQTGPGSVAFTGTVDPEGVPLTGCRFRYLDKITFTQAGFEKPAAGEIVRFGETVPCEEVPGELDGTAPIVVHAEVAGLEPGEYVFRVEGENAYEDAIASGVPFTVASLPAPGNLPPGNLPPSGVIPPGLTKAPGLKTAPGLHKPRKKKLGKRGVRRNATIVAPR